MIRLTPDTFSFRHGRPASIRQLPAIVTLIVASTLMPSQTVQAEAQRRHAITTAAGSTVSNVDVWREGVLVGTSGITGSPAGTALELPLGEFVVKDSRPGDGASPDELTAEILGCRAGATPLPDSSVHLEMSGRTTLSLAQQGARPFPVVMRAQLPNGVAGALTCAVASLMDSRSRLPLLTFRISVQLVPKPEWRNVHGQAIRGIAFDFSTQLGQGKSPAPVESAEERAILANPLNDAPCLHLTTPRRCTIGTAPVDDRHVLLVINGKEVGGDTCVQPSVRTPIAMRLLFAKAGFYNRWHGSVQCQQPGELIYSY